jgi:valyl-tRNA synthetase
LKTNAEQLRKFSTEAESALWEMLRATKMGVKFNRQHVIDEYIVDFVCLDKYIVIEVDGGYHNDTEIKQHDEMRTTILNSLGFEVLRFTNEDVLFNTDKVLEKISYAVQHPPLGGTGGGFCVVATTRPETIMGDTAMCINPNDPKNQHLKGKKVIVPLVNRVIPVIEDDYVDIEFGTGCLKVTPAHDVNDYMLGEKYNLPSIDIFNDNGTISEAGEIYVGMDRFDVREQIVKDLGEAGLLEKVEDYTNKVGYSERTDVPIEPKLSMQWFLKMEELAKPALDAVMDDTIKFFPSKFKNTYRHWMENVKDWCISRQLWWGHRIPAYYLPEGGYVIAGTDDEALSLARTKSGNAALQLSDLRRDEDCLDTWFSSWLWPISVFDGINNPDTEDIKYYYPTNDLVTGPDIIFFWVARMIMSGYEYRGQECFRNVYFTGIVRDKLGRKMSKQLGNSPDPIELINKYGADGVRMGMMLAAPAGNDIRFDEALCEQGRNFNNKIWNALRLLKGLEIVDIEQPVSSKIAVEWFDSKLSQSIEELEGLFGKYRISEALMTVYKLFWDEFSAWYLELIKPVYQQPIDRKTYEQTLVFFEKLLKLLHPFMPFITEELYHTLRERSAGDSIMIAQMPEKKEINSALIAKLDETKEIIFAIRAVRTDKNIPNKELLKLQMATDKTDILSEVVIKLGNLSSIETVKEKSAASVSFLVGTTEFSIPLEINKEEEIKKMEKEIYYLQGFLKSVQNKLSNEKFVANAKPEVVENERKKFADAESKIKSLEENIYQLK